MPLVVILNLFRDTYFLVVVRRVTFKSTSSYSFNTSAYAYGG
jgi:hypothetical protein